MTIFIFSHENYVFTMVRVARHSGNSGILENFQIPQNLRETQGILISFFKLGKLREVLIFSKNFWEVL